MDLDVAGSNPASPAMIERWDIYKIREYICTGVNPDHYKHYRHERGSGTVVLWDPGDEHAWQAVYMPIDEAIRAVIRGLP